MHVLYIDPDTRAVSSTRKMFEQNGFVVSTCTTGEIGYYYATEFSIDAILLSAQLPDTSGVALVQQIRDSRVHIPICVLGRSNDVCEQISLLDAGADTYLATPCRDALVVASIRALVRRANRVVTNVLTIEDLTVHLHARQVFVSATKLPLTYYEYLALECLSLRVPYPVTKAEMDDLLYGSDSAHISDVLTPHISRLRRKIREAGGRTLPTNREGVGMVLQRCDEYVA